jgi:hypothetical protein
MRSLSTKMASPCRSCASSTWGICCANPKISPCASFARPQRPPGPLRAHARGHADGGERRLLRASWLDGAATRRPRRASLNDHRSTPRLGNSWVPCRRQGPSGTHPRGHQLGRAFSSAPIVASTSSMAKGLATKPSAPTRHSLTPSPMAGLDASSRMGSQNRFHNSPGGKPPAGNMRDIGTFAPSWSHLAKTAWQVGGFQHPA